MAHVVDTCGWIEWLTDGVLADKYAPYLESLEEVHVPTSVQFELYKWVKRESSEEQALEVIEGRLHHVSPFERIRLLEESVEW